MKIKLVAILTASVAALQVLGAAFQNLGFDEANTNRLERAPDGGPLLPGLHGSAADLLPGWTLFLNDTKYDGPVYWGLGYVNLPGLSKAPNIDLIHGYYFEFRNDIIGNFVADFRIQQKGMVPADAWELLAFDYSCMYINGVELAYETRPGFNLGAYNVREFAGQEVLLEFRTYNNKGERGGISIDLLGFAVPEPSEWALLATGAAVLFGASRRAATSVRRRPAA